MFNVFGITFHLYGLLVGLALVVGLQLVEYRYKKIDSPPFSEQQLWQVVVVAVVCGVFGGRAWHVATDWHLYQQNPIMALYIWNGGMSILGAVVGGVAGTWIAMKLLSFSKPIKNSIMLFDLVIFGMPIAQAVGRFGNYVNQELYGLPTTLPWAITIDEAHRVAGFEQFSRFHPLFAYEVVLTFTFGCAVWWLWKIKNPAWMQLGTGNLALFYLAYYSLTRFLLEFLRIEKTLFWETPFGFNQVVLLFTGLGAVLFLSKRFLLNAKK